MAVEQTVITVQVELDKPEILEALQEAYREGYKSGSRVENRMKSRRDSYQRGLDQGHHDCQPELQSLRARVRNLEATRRRQAMLLEKASGEITHLYRKIKELGRPKVVAIVKTFPFTARYHQTCQCCGEQLHETIFVLARFADGSTEYVHHDCANADLQR